MSCFLYIRLPQSLKLNNIILILVWVQGADDNKVDILCMERHPISFPGCVLYTQLFCTASNKLRDYRNEAIIPAWVFSIPVRCFLYTH